MLELELEQCRTSYQREYQRTRDRLVQLENENIDLCKSIDENTVDDAMKQQISNVVHENLVRSRTAPSRRCTARLVSSRLGASSANSEQPV
jgi:hypothetical protein